MKACASPSAKAEEPSAPASSPKSSNNYAKSIRPYWGTKTPNGQSEHPHSIAGLRSPHSRPVDQRDRQYRKADRCSDTRPDPAADQDREVHRVALAAYRQEVARAVRDPHPQARARHRRPDAADRRRAHEARSRRRRRRRNQALRIAMRTGLLARKLGMTRIFTDDGNHVPVTVLAVDNCQVVAVRTPEKDGYCALQLGVGTAKVKNVSKAQRGH